MTYVLPPIHVGGPGSGKGRIVANLRSMFGMKLISTESIVLKYLPKKVQHVMDISSTDVSCNACLHLYSIIITPYLWREQGEERYETENPP